jgi:hypothetical protein
MRRWPFRCVLAPKLCSVIVLLGARSLAQPNDTAPGAAGSGPAAPPLRLSWSSSEPECDGDLVAARALQMLGQGVTPPQVEARAAVSRDGLVWTVKLETRSENQAGTRVVSGETCKEIQDAVSLLLTMILESERQASPSPIPPRSIPPPAQPTSPEPPSKPLSGVTPTLQATTETALFDDGEEEATDADPAEAGAELGALLRLHGSASVGLQPDVGLGFGAAAGVHWRSWDLALSATYWPSTRANLRARAGYVDIARLGMGIRGCFTAWSAGDLDVAGCVLPELTLFRFASFDILRRRHGDTGRLLLSGTAALELRYRLWGRHISAVLSPAVTWEKTQPFHVNVFAFCEVEPCEPLDPIQVHETSGVGGRLEIGVDARF